MKYYVSSQTKHVKKMIESRYVKSVTLKDIHNLKAQMKTEAHGGLHDAQLLLVELDILSKITH